MKHIAKFEYNGSLGVYFVTVYKVADIDGVIDTPVAHHNMFFAGYEASNDGLKYTPTRVAAMSDKEIQIELECWLTNYLGQDNLKDRLSAFEASSEDE